MSDEFLAAIFFLIVFPAVLMGTIILALFMA
jgi:hypothetical protein